MGCVRICFRAKSFLRSTPRFRELEREASAFIPSLLHDGRCATVVSCAPRNSSRATCDVAANLRAPRLETHCSAIASPPPRPPPLPAPTPRARATASESTRREASVQVSAHAGRMREPRTGVTLTPWAAPRPLQPGAACVYRHAALRFGSVTLRGGRGSAAEACQGAQGPPRAGEASSHVQRAQHVKGSVRGDRRW